MVDKTSFVRMLLHVSNVEARQDIQIERWQEELTASGACDASNVVDVKHFVAFCLQGGVGGAATVLGMLSRPQQEDEILATPSEPSKNMLAAINKAGGPNPPSGGDMSSSSWTLSTAVIGEQTPLPSPEDQAGALVVVNSKQYVLGERLGHGAGGSVFAADVHVHVTGDEECESHDPESMALKLVAGVGDA
eukprot:1779234-Amphidinium_carterae.1